MSVREPATALGVAPPRNALIMREQLCREPRMSRVLAAFVDVSGYTAFAEQIIAQHKDRGLGQLVDELERILVPAANAALRQRGNIVAVEGDALMVTFDEADDLVRFCREVEPHRRSIARTPDGVSHRLQLDIGVSHGRLYEAVVGDDEGRAYIAAGSALRAAREVERRSAGGRIALTFPLRGATRERELGGSEERYYYTIAPEELPEVDVPSPSGFWQRVFQRREDRTPTDDTPTGRTSAAAAAGRLPSGEMPIDDAAYVASFGASVPRHVRSQLLSPVIVFSDLPLIRMAFASVAPRDGEGPEPERARAALQELYLGLREIVERRGEGLIAKVKAESSLLLFGAPRPTDDAALKAFEAMSRVHRLHLDLCEKHGLSRRSSISGMHKGDALCGPILGQYDAIGASVNLAARIKASGLIDYHRSELSGPRRRIRFTRELLDDDRVARFVRGYQVDRLRLKGLDETITVYFDFSSIVGLGASDDSFVLRQRELDELIARARRAIGAPGAGQVVNVVGDLGSGKDRLLAQLAAELEQEHRTYGVRCTPYHKDDPYRTLLELLKKVCRAASDRELYRRAIGHTPHSERDLAAALRYFEGRLLSIPAVLIINNGENIDRESSAFLERLAPLFVEAGCFVAYSGTAALFSTGVEIGLGDLGHDAAFDFARRVAEACHPEQAELSAAELEELFGATQGNPLFIAEYVKAMSVAEQGQLELERTPATLRDMLLRQVQHALGPSPLLQAALEQYALMHSVALMAPLLDEQADANMLALREAGFLGDDYEFVADLLRRSLAESMDPRRRQRLCSRLARAAEEAGLADHLATFEYFRRGELSDEDRRRALNHALRHLEDPGHLARVRDDFFEDLLVIADLADGEQRQGCCRVLLAKAGALVASETAEASARAYALAKRASSLQRGDPRRCLALAAMAEASCGEAEAGAGPAALAGARRLFDEAREAALESRDGRLCWEIACRQAETLLAQPAAEALEVLLALEETERRLPGLVGLEPSPSLDRLSARFDRLLAEAHARGGEVAAAERDLELAATKSVRAGWTAGEVGCEAARAELLCRVGDDAGARRVAEAALVTAARAGLGVVHREVRRLRALLEPDPVEHED